MPRYAQMLSRGMEQRGHQTEAWAPSARFHKLTAHPFLRKWCGYVDQYIIFPLEVRLRLRRLPRDTFFVFTDQALGPWVSLTAHRPHVVHCHDFLAQRSALGEIPENPTSKTGQWYQSYIRWGYSKGENFISVSQNTRNDLHELLGRTPATSEVVYNGLNQTFVPLDPAQVRAELSRHFRLDLEAGYILHVGGNQWYKNRPGVLEIYDEWRSTTHVRLPLIMIGAPPTEEMTTLRAKSAYGEDVHFLEGVGDAEVRRAYAGASLFLFPSLAEGFGWPIAEAMASGCPVITTALPPMSEVAGDAGRLISRRPVGNGEPVKAWRKEGAAAIDCLLNLTENGQRDLLERQALNARRFDPLATLDRMEEIYKSLNASYADRQSSTY